jgi:polysaccharide biosynthesis/export protein
MTSLFVAPKSVLVSGRSKQTRCWRLRLSLKGCSFAFGAILAFTAPDISQGAGQPDDDIPVAKALPATAAGFANSMNVLDASRALRAGDRLSFRVIEDGDPIVPLAVTDSGEMEVPYIGRVEAAGKTCKALALEIKSKLEKVYYIQATVLLGLDQAAPVKSPGRVYLVGQVPQQGAQEIPPDETYTVSKAILKAGGFADFADKRKVKLVRRGNKGGSDAQIVDLVEVLQKGRTDNDPVVHPDDLIIVPQRLINY